MHRGIKKVSSYATKAKEEGFELKINEKEYLSTVQFCEPGGEVCSFPYYIETIVSSGKYGLLLSDTGFSRESISAKEMSKVKMYLRDWIKENFDGENIEEFAEKHEEFRKEKARSEMKERSRG